MALANAGARADPLVGGIHALCQVVVGDDVARQIAAAAYDSGIDHAASAVFCPAASRRWEMRCSTPSRTSSKAPSIAFSNPKLSAEPWLFTTMPFRPSRLAPL